jgi:lysophospholipase L1-like esterase
VYYIAYALIYAGWLFHRSDNAVALGYSRGYLALLLAMAVPFALPPVLALLARRFGYRTVLFAAAPALTLLLVAYAIAAQYYYQTQQHAFDPFLQNHATQFDEYALTKPTGTVRILTIGGSTTRNAHLAAEDRYPLQLRETLRSRLPATKFEVLNAGAEWWTTKHSLINYTTYASRWRPDIVVVMHAINDAMQSFSPPRFTIGNYNDQWNHFYGAAIQGARPPSFEKHLFRGLLMPWYSERLQPDDFPLAAFASLLMYRQHLASIFRYVQADGAEVVLVTQPSLYKKEMSKPEAHVLQMDRIYFVARNGWFWQRYPNVPSMRRAMDAYNQAGREVAISYGVNVVDAAERMSRDLDHFVDDVHQTPRGARQLAEMIAQALIDNGALERAQPGALQKNSRAPYSNPHAESPLGRSG